MNKITSFLQKLISESFGLDLQATAQLDPLLPNTFDQDFTRWKLSSLQILRHLGIDFYVTEFTSFMELDESSGRFIQRMAGVLESAKECVESGVTGKMKHLLHAEMFDSVIAQAKGLLDTGHMVPAAVLGRIVIENWLRDQGEKAGITDWETAKASALNDSLKSALLFSTPKWRQIQSFLDIGNSAAHGNDKDFTATDVQRMLDFGEANCV